jgi:hypothetical protein
MATTYSRVFWNKISFNANWILTMDFNLCFYKLLSTHASPILAYLSQTSWSNWWILAKMIVHVLKIFPHVNTNLVIYHDILTNFDIVCPKQVFAYGIWRFNVVHETTLNRAIINVTKFLPSSLTWTRILSVRLIILKGVSFV